MYTNPLPQPQGRAEKLGQTQSGSAVPRGTEILGQLTHSLRQGSVAGRGEFLTQVSMALRCWATGAE